MKWIVLALAVVACVLFAIGKWTSASSESPDERAGADVPYFLSALALVVCVCLLAGWAVVHLLFS